MRTNFPSLGMKSVIRLCAIVLTVWSLMGSERAMAQAPVFRRGDTVEVRICYSGSTSDTVKRLDTLLNVNCGAGDSIVWTYIGSGGFGASLTTPLDTARGASGLGGPGIDVRAATPFNITSTSNSSNSVRYFPYKATSVMTGLSDTIVVELKEFIPPSSNAVVGLFDEVHFGDSIQFSNLSSGGTWLVQSGTRGTFIPADSTNGNLVYGLGAPGSDSVVYRKSNVCFTTDSTAPVKFLSSVPPTYSTSTPIITAIDTMWSIPRNTIALTGSNFNTTAAFNIVRFGGARARVTSASSGSLTVSVPVGALFDRISVTDSISHLTGYMRHPFTPSWNNSAFVDTTLLRFTTYDTIILRGGVGAGATGVKPYSIEMADLDGDGKLDMVVCGTTLASSVYVLRNISTSGTVNASSFDTARAFRVAPRDTTSFINSKMADMDGDGLQEILVLSPSTSRVYIYPNISTPGNIAFSTPFFVGLSLGGIPTPANPPAVLPSEIAVADFNRDGRPDVGVIATGAVRGTYGLTFSYPGSFWVIKNEYNRRKDTSLAMSAFDFSIAREFIFDTVTSSPLSLCAGDFDGDGKLDVAVSDHYARDFKIFRNISTGRNITFDTGLTAVSTAENGLTPGSTCRALNGRGGYPNQIRCADFNRDGIQEIVVAVSDSDLRANNLYNFVRVYRNTTYPSVGFAFATSFKFKTGVAPVGIAIGDLDGDSYLDMAVTNSGAGSVSIIKNTSSGGAISVGSFDTTNSKEMLIERRASTALAGTTGINGGPVSVVIGDIDNNTVNDMAVVSREANLVSILGDHPVPVVGPIITSRDSICLGSNMAIHSSRANSSFGSGAWTVSNPRLSVTASGTGMADTSATITALSLGVDTVFYTVTAHAESVTVMKIITVVDTAHGGVITGPSGVCLNSTITLNNALGTLGTWSTSAAATASITTTASTTPATILGVAVGSATISYIAVSATGVCPNDTSVKTITVNALPNRGVITGNATPCSSSPSTYTETVSGGTWSLTSTALASIASASATTATLTTGSGTGFDTILYVVTTPTCGNDTARFAINIISSIAPPVTGNRSVCVGSNTTLSNTMTGGTWSSSAIAIATIDATSGVVTGLSAGNVTITYTAATCGASDTFDMVVNALPDVTGIAGPASVCFGSTPTYTTTLAAGSGAISSTTWSSLDVAHATIGSSSGTLTVADSTFSGSVIIKVVVSSLSCGSDSTTRSITISPRAFVGTISGADSICGNTAATLYTISSSGPGTPVRPWSVVGTHGTIVDSTGSYTPGSTAGIDTIVYTVTVAGCGTATATKTVRVKAAAPRVDSLTGPASVCFGSTGTYTSFATGVVTTTTWTSLDVSHATMASTTGVLTPADSTFSGAVTIKVRVTNSCGSDSMNKSVTINQRPFVGTISGADTVCASGSTTLYIISASGPGTIARPWSATGGHGTIVDSTGSFTPGSTSGAETIIYTASTVSCGTVTATKAVFVRASTPPVISGPDSVCKTFSILLRTSATGGTWTSTNSSIASVVGLGGDSSRVTGVAAGTTTISYSVTGAGCSAVIDTQTITVNDLPNAGTITGAATADSICPGTTVIFTSSVAGTGTWSTSSATVASVDAGGLVTGVMTTGGTATISYTVVSVHGCGTVAATRPIVVKANPNAGTITGRDPLCASDTATYRSSGDVANHVWSVTSAFASISSSTGFATASSSAGFPFGRAGVISYKTTNSCGSDSTTLSVTVRTKPNLSPITGTNPVCAGSTVTYSASGTTGTGGSIMWGSSSTSIASITSARTGTSSLTSVTVAIDTFYTQTYVIIVDTARNICGDSMVRDSVVINPLAKIDAVTGPDTLCFGTTGTYIARGILDTSGVWNGTGSVTYNSQHDSTFLVDAVSGGAGLVSYTVTSPGCGIVTKTKNVRVITAPNAGPDRSYTKLVCPGSTIMDTADAVNSPTVWVSADTFIAYATTGASVDTVTGNHPGNVIIYNIHTNRCGSDTANFPVQVQAPAPNAGNIVGPDSACVGVPFTFTDSTYDTTYAPGAWSTASASIASITNLRDSTVTVTGVRAGTSIITFTIGNSCGNTITTKSVKINAFPVFTAQNPSVCDSVMLNYTPIYDSTGLGSLFTWSRAGVAGISNIADSGTGAFTVYLDDTTNHTVSVPYNVKVSMHGCVTNATETITVKPTPYLVSTKNVTVCSGSPFIYLDTSNVTGTTSTWTRPTTITNLTTTGSSSGTGRISDMFTSSILTPVTFQYSYHLIAAGCFSDAKLNVSVNPRPTFPAILTHPQSTNLCTGTMYVNFGTNITPPAGVNYTWTASNAEVWATGNTRQYCLVNFTKPGTSYVYVLATLTGYNCPAKDSFGVIVNNSVSDTPRVIYFAGDFVCLSNVEDSYQWGYDDHNTLDSATFPGETNQNYTNVSPDFNGKYYWVITTKGECMQKSYYKIPTGVNTITGNMGEVKIYPNPTSQYLNVEVLNTSGGSFSLQVSNMMGQSISSTKMNGYQGTVDVSDLASGIYFIDCYRDGVKFATQKFVKN